ncbi:hypothetical protein [Sporanaerobacter acetigenes]|uniref:Uncharacterized protein n=1 Tax=Sporanaerobacter acetigenes DSM 13106 TaxID=1123281 RepID=A0A1M5U9D0_9FIRM|nr:hypothetical protein [Sporanaerobacter acetigenes]SHH59528.1 hypothetical protein SAMN02745180_00566 [Sporanaerobacter acetigenes DSM 13106]
MGKKSFLNRLKRIFLYLNHKYDQLQKSEIILGENKDLPVYFYRKPDFGWMQMREIRLGLEKGLDVSHYAKEDISVEQMEEIRLGLEKGLDVSLFNNTDFDWMQMREIRLGLEKELDVSHYAKKNMSVEQMEEIRLGLEKGLDVSLFNNADFDWMQMREIRLGLEKDLDTSFYDSLEYNWQQMREIRLGMERGINVYEYITPENSWEEMKKSRLEQLREKFMETNSLSSYTNFYANKEVEKSNELKEKSQNISRVSVEKDKTRDIKKEDNLKNKRDIEDEFNLSKFDVNMIFPQIKKYNTEQLLKENIMRKYSSPKEAKKTFNIQKKRIEKLIDEGYIEVVDNKYSITQKAIEESKEINEEFEFTSYDSNKVFGYILKAGGSLTLKELKNQIKKEYTDEIYANKQYEYLKKRLENNFKEGYVIKNEDDSYSISKLGMEKAKEIKQKEPKLNEKQLEFETEEEIEI